MGLGYWQRFKSESEKFWEKVDSSGECWNWKTTASKGDYGKFKFRGKTISASRASWTLANGEIPDGMCVLHKCDNPACVRPAHLFLGTKRDNAKDMWSKGRNANNLRLRQNAKIDERAVKLIRLLTAFRQCDIGKMFGLSQSTISDITTGRCWGNVEFPARCVTVSLPR